MVDKSFQALTISLLIHAILTMVFVQLELPPPAQTPIEIEILSEKSLPERKNRQVVDETHEKPEDETLDKLKLQADLLSKYAKRFKEQQQAKNKTGETQNAVGQNGNSNKEGKGRSPSKPLDLSPLDTLGTVPRVKQDHAAGSSLRGSLNNSVVLGDSTGADFIPGVKDGSFTALNTDQFTHYSFFERVRNAIRYRWITGVRNFAQNAPAKVINQLSRVPSPTQVEVLLTPTGEVVRVLVLKSSGADNLDEAAVVAFKNASPLNHPPDEMVEGDGLIHLHFAFRVHWNPVFVADGQ